MRNALRGGADVRKRREIEIEALAVEQAADSRPLFDVVHDWGATVVWAAGESRPGEGIGAIDKGQGRKDRTWFTEGDVDARHTATLGCIVHAWQVIEDERSRVEIFKCDGKAVRILSIQPIGSGHLEDHAGAHQAARSEEHTSELQSP